MPWKVSHDRTALPDHRSRTLRAAAMKDCTGPSETDSKAPPCAPSRLAHKPLVMSAC